MNQDGFEEYQEIDLGGTFSGIDALKMAIEGGMETEDTFIFAPTSSAMHREWTTLDRFALERCQNPLHRWHRVPRRDLSVVIGPEIIHTGFSKVEELIDANEQAVIGLAGAPIGEVESPET